MDRHLGQWQMWKQFWLRVWGAESYLQSLHDIFITCSVKCQKTLCSEQLSSIRNPILHALQDNMCFCVFCGLLVNCILKLFAPSFSSPQIILHVITVLPSFSSFFSQITSLRLQRCDFSSSIASSSRTGNKRRIQLNTVHWPGLITLYVRQD